MMSKCILLILKVPPPIGGGELWAQWLWDYTRDMGGVSAITLVSRRRDKGNQGRFAVWKIWEFLLNLGRVWRAVRVVRPGVILLSAPKTTLPFLRDYCYVLLGRLYGARCVLELHGGGFDFLPAKGPLDRFAASRLRAVDSIRVLGDAVRKELVEGLEGSGPEIVVIPNGVPDPDLRVTASELGERRKVVFVGTHSREKGFFDLLEILRIVREKFPDVALDCIGSWPSEEVREKAYAQVRKWGLGGSVRFLGVLEGRAKEAVLAESGLLVLPSYKEGMPLVILEAYAAGLPVVATDVGAVAEMIKVGRTGFICKPGDVAGLARAIGEILGNGEMHRAMGEAAREEYEKRYQLGQRLREEIAWVRGLLKSAR